MTPSGLAEEHVLWRQVVREFVDRDVAPIAGELERRGEYPDALLPTLAELGLLGMSIPVEHGGSDLDMVSFAIAYEELARGWMGLASIVGSSSSGAWLISRHGTDEQRRRWLPDLAVGRRVSGLALTEPAAGSDLRSIQVSAARDGDTYR
ncbi:MAG: acyl-CoA dehydrogenase family protein, partial [Micromonosporaceae bacterium]